MTTTKNAPEEVQALFDNVRDYYPAEYSDLSRAFALGQMQGIRRAAAMFGVEIRQMDLVVPRDLRDHLPGPLSEWDDDPEAYGETPTRATTYKDECERLDV